MNQNQPASQTMRRKRMIMIGVLLLLILISGYLIYSHLNEQINYAVNHMGSEPFE